MKKDAKEFIAKASGDEELRKRLDALMNLPENERAGKAAVIAQDAGFDVVAEDFAPVEAELDLDELNAVAGGIDFPKDLDCFCAYDGWGPKWGFRDGTCSLCSGL